MYGARAVLKEALLAHPSEHFALYVVWMPMVPTDSEWSARRESTMFNDSRVKQYYDAHRRIGLAYTNDVFMSCAQRTLAVLPKDDPLRPPLEHWAGLANKKRAMWDALFFYGPNAEWRDAAPAPDRWTKQTHFRGPGDGTSVTADFWRDCGRPPIASDWSLEVRQMMTDGPRRP